MAKNKNKLHRHEVYMKSGFDCAYCGLYFPPPKDWDGVSAIHYHGMFLEIDHIKPTSKGGEDTVENKQALCQECNNKKSDKHE